MVGGANAAGIVATSAIVLPALGFAIGPIFKSTPVRWEGVGPTSMFTEHNYVPVILTLTPTIGEAGKTTVYVRKYNPAIDTDPYDKDTAFIAISSRCAHLGCPVRWVDAAERFICPCHGGVYDLLGRPVGGPPVRPLDRFYTRVNGETSSSARASASTASCGASRRATRASRSTASASTSIRPGRARRNCRPQAMPKLPAPPVPQALKGPPPAARRRERQGHAARPRGRGRHHRRRLGRRAHLADRRRALADVPQGPARARTGSTRSARRRCSPSSRRPSPACSWRCTTGPTRRAAPTNRSATSPTTCSSASSCAGCTSGAPA